MKLKNKLQKLLKSKKIEIKRKRTKPKSNTKWRTKLNFYRPGVKTKVHGRETKDRRKNLIIVELLPVLVSVPPQQLCHILVHRMRR